MLTHLHIRNYTIVDTLELELHHGMTTITGETGAGKSITFDALALCLGSRADSKAIRPNTTNCEITASFSIAKIPLAQQWLTEHDLACDDECILRRTINIDGRSRSYVNGNPTPLQLTRELGTLLVSITGQHEHQLLLKIEHQRQLLDAYADHIKLLTQVENSHHAYRETQKNLDRLLQQSIDPARQELLQYQVEELEELGLGENELLALENEHKTIANADLLIHQCQLALDTATSDKPEAIRNQLYRIQENLSPLQSLNEAIASSQKLFGNAIIQVDEACNELKAYLDGINCDEERLSYLEQRLQKIYDIARKHKIKPIELTSFHQELVSQLAQCENSEVIIAELQTKLVDEKKQYQKYAKKLSQSREKASTKLAKEVCQSMHTLGMPGGVFSIQLTTVSLEQASSHGMDKIEFLVSANPGQPLQPLNKVASGGELARISLAIQVITAQRYATPTLLFDEVDVGIGGGTAEVVGQLLRKLGESAQVICVTHQAQVAASAHQHLCVSKATDNKTTSTQVSELNLTQKVEEIARMIGGIKITKQTLAHAEEMLAS